MSFTFIGLLLLFPLLSLAADNVEIKDPNLAADLLLIQAEIDAVSEAVTQCMDGGGEHRDCMCQNQDKFTQFTAIVNGVLSRHPRLANLDLVHFHAEDGTLINQSLVGIRRQAEMTLSCP